MNKIDEIKEILEWVRTQKDDSRLPEIDDSDVVDCGYDIQGLTDDMNRAWRNTRDLLESCEDRWGKNHSNTRKVQVAYDMLDDLCYSALPAKQHMRNLKIAIFRDKCVSIIQDKAEKTWKWNNDQVWNTIWAIEDDGAADEFFGQRVTKKILVSIMKNAD